MYIRSVFIVTAATASAAGNRKAQHQCIHRSVGYRHVRLPFLSTRITLSAFFFDRAPCDLPSGGGGPGLLLHGGRCRMEEHTADGLGTGSPGPFRYLPFRDLAGCDIAPGGNKRQSLQRCSRWTRKTGYPLFPPAFAFGRAIYGAHDGSAMSDRANRSVEKITSNDLKHLSQLALSNFEDFFERNPKPPYYGLPGQVQSTSDRPTRSDEDPGGRGYQRCGLTGIAYGAHAS
jgi:hypothetical protein